MTLVFIGICKNASSSLWSMIHGRNGIFKTSFGQHDTIMKRKAEIEKAKKVLVVTRHPYSRWMSMYTFLQYQPKWKGLDPDIVLDRIRIAQMEGKLDPVGIGRTNLDIVFCPQWTWLGKTPAEAKMTLKQNKTILLDCHRLQNDMRRKVPELKGNVRCENKTSQERRNTYNRMTTHQRQMVQAIWKEDFDLFGWDRSWFPESGTIPDRKNLYE